MGLKVLERYVFVSTSEIEVGEKQSDYDDIEEKICSYDIRYNCHLDFEGLQEKKMWVRKVSRKKN